MAKVLKITKADGSNHAVPLAFKTFYQHQNNLLPADQKWTIKEIDEKEAENMPFIDEDFKTPIEALEESKGLRSENEALKAQLDALLAERNILSHGQSGPVGRVGGDPATATEGALNTGVNNPANVVAPDLSKDALASAQAVSKTAAEVIESIKGAATVDQVNALANGDERKTVQDAAKAKIADLTK